MSDNFFLQHNKAVARYILKHEHLSQQTDAEIKAMAREHAQHVIRQEVALSDDLAASFHREAQSLSLVSEHCVLFLDREETYRLLSLLEAEFKGMTV